MGYEISATERESREKYAQVHKSHGKIPVKKQPTLGASPATRKSSEEKQYVLFYYVPTPFIGLFHKI